ncbi:MAG: type II secretion system F family protein [Planctomycetota bacterium]
MAKKLQRRVPAPKAAPPRTAARKESSGIPLRLSRGRVTPKLLAEFTNQLAVLLNAGIPITKSLRILGGQFPPGPMKRTCNALLEDVEGGTSLSEAMAKHQLVFDSLYTNMVRAGEAGGVQEEILTRLATFLEKSEVIKSRVKGALAYPAAIVGVATLVLTLVFVFVIPKFEEIFTGMLGPTGMDKLHWTTKTVIGLGKHFQVWWPVYLGSILAVYLLHRLLLARVHGYRRFCHGLALRFPIFGPLVKKNLVARFSRTLGTLIQSGVPHLEALDIIEASVGNVHMKDAVRAVHASIREGAGIATPMGDSGIFDDIVVNMVDVGEQTGELDRMLVKIADRYEMEVDRTVDTTFRMIEPILLVVMAVVVGFIVFALFTPLLTLMQNLNRR